MQHWREVRNSDVRLAVREFGGTGETVLLLHGLVGYSGEWTTVAELLTDRFHVFALDLRGHGNSERHPTDVSPDAYRDDAVTVAKAVHSDGRVHLVGQSFGGHVAFLVAARHPELTRSLTVIEADPAGPKPEIVDGIARWLSSWPRPFDSRDAALRFFGNGAAATAWVDGLEIRDDGYWPRFHNEVLVAALRQLTNRSWWQEWQRIACRTLVVRGEDGRLSATVADRMAALLRDARVVNVAGAAHEVQLDQPEALARELKHFLGS